MFIILYAKIIDDKKQGLELDGPFLGPEHETMSETHKACSDLVKENKHHLLIRIYDLNKMTEKEARLKSKAAFTAIYKDMLQSLALLERPTIKRKKKKKFKIRSK